MKHDQWAIYYGDGSRFHRSMGPWEVAEPWDVQGVVVPSEAAGAQVLYAGDYYFRKVDGCCYSTDRIGLLDYLLNEQKIVTSVRCGTTTTFLLRDEEWLDWDGLVLALVHEGFLKIGRAKTYEDWNQILNHMIEHKSALLMGEPRPIGKIG